MLDEREAWMERRASFTTLYVDTRPATPPVGHIVPMGVLLVPPGVALGGFAFDLIVAPASVQRDHKRWLEDVLLPRLLPNGKLILVDDPLL